MATLFASIPGVTLPAPQPVPPPTVSGPLGRYLTHPGATTSLLVHHLAHLVVHLGTTFGPVAAGVALVGLVVVTVARRTQARRMGEDARLVRVLSPPDVDPQGAATLWTNLVALLRPAWRRFLGGQPHLGFELSASDGGLTIAIWVPGRIPPGLVERAVEAAWPGARTETVAAVPPLVGDGVATGGTLGLALPEHYPLRTEHKVDPLRPLVGALSGLDEGESAGVQILARPVTGRRLTRLHRAAAARRSGRPANRLARLVDLVTPGPGAQAAATDPSRGADVADILDKAAQPCWAIAVRYAVATTATDRQAAARLRGRAHAVASAFALFAGRNRLDRHRLRHPAEVLAARRLGRGNLVSVAELAALAHLPTDAAVPGLARAGANAVAPPPAVSRTVQGSGAPQRATSTDGRKLLGDA
ncbi:MAG: type VI secretion protein, partial [Acidimicrobiales bacterium]